MRHQHGLGLIALSLIQLVVCGCASVPPSPWDKKSEDPLVLEKSEKIMGGPVKVRLWLTEAQKANAQKFFDTTFFEIRRVALIADDEDPKSEISKLNAKAFNNPTPVSKELYKLILMAQSLYQISDGSFDITFVPIQDEIEKFGADTGLTESVQEFNPQVDADLRKKIGQRNLFIDDRTSTVKFTRTGMKIGVKGLAKGYAIQRAAEKLMALRMRGFALVAGGVLIAGGEALKDPNLMCIENPQKLGSCLYKVVPLDMKKTISMAMASTLDRPGRIYNPKTGKRAVKTGGPVTLAGSDATWVQGASVAISAMDDAKVEAFLVKAGKGIVASVLFPTPDSTEIKGTFAPHAKVKKIEQ